MRFWLALHPDVRRPIGGVKQMHRLCECIHDLGFEAHLIQDDPDFHPGWFNSNVSTISLHRWISLRDNGELNSSQDVVIVPETFLPVLGTYAASLPVVIFNQNGSYSFGTTNSKKRWKPDVVVNNYHHSRVVHVMCVSRHDQSLLINGFGLPPERVSCIRNGLEIDHCIPTSPKSLRMAFMPRKNAFDASIVSELLQRQHWMKRWQLVEISSQSHSNVIKALQASTLFLSFGHPEGFGLPVAESMACGCAVVGYSGLGGRELFDLGKGYSTTREVAYGDWYGFVSAAQAFDQQARDDPRDLGSRLLKASQAVRRLYSREKMLSSVNDSLNQIILACSNSSSSYLDSSVS